MPSTLGATALGLLCFFLVGPRVADATGSAYWLQPSQKWLEIDGIWSSFEVNIGKPAQPVQLTVSTALSEVWAVGKGGCLDNNALCTSQRGNVYNSAASNTFESLGAWDLGLTTSPFNANGDYGLDTFAAFNSIQGHTMTVDGALVASINTTDYYQGYIGVGVIRGKFGSRMTRPLISQLAEESGAIPSHSYGYTAGAWHINGGVPASLVMGGYDSLRLQNHDTVFSLHPDTRMPQVRIRGLSIDAKDPSTSPGNWAGQNSNQLVSMADSLVTFVDSSLPYLVLPGPICDRFSAALNLTYNSTYDLYTWQNDTASMEYLSKNMLSFTFSLSSWDDNDNLGNPLQSRGVVNITISGQAFVSFLSYPFKNAFAPDSPSSYYFPLRRANNDNELVIGRAFMQEAYIVTKYDERVFSLHQALFPDNAANNYSLVDIPRSANSEYPPFVSSSQPGQGLTVAQTAGIAVGAAALTAAIGLAIWLFCRRRRQRQRRNSTGTGTGGAKSVEDPLSPGTKKAAFGDDGVSTLGPSEPATTPMSQMMSLLKIHQATNPGHMPNELASESTHELDGTRTLPAEVDGSHTLPVEIAADNSHERYEMPAPPEPVELDASHDYGLSDEATELGTEESTDQTLSEYELTRRRLQRQLQGPLPAYSPPASAAAMVDCEKNYRVEEARDQAKSIRDPSLLGYFRPPSKGHPSPMISMPSDGNHGNSLPISLPSPISPQPDYWVPRTTDLPSPVTLASPRQPTLRRSESVSSPREQRQHFAPLSRSVSASSRFPVSPSSCPPASPTARPHPPSDPLSPPSPTWQRTPIDQSKIVYLGPLPDHIHPPNHKLPALPPNKTPSTTSPTHPAVAHVVPSPLPQPLGPRHGLRIDTPSGLPRSVVGPSSESLGGDYTVVEQKVPREAIPFISATNNNSNSSNHHTTTSTSTSNTNTTTTTTNVPTSSNNNNNNTRNSNSNDAGSAIPQSLTSPERIEAADELVHVPQVAEKRYSWEHN